MRKETARGPGVIGLLAVTLISGGLRAQPAPPTAYLSKPVHGEIFSTPAYPALAITLGQTTTAVQRVDYLNGMQAIEAVAMEPFSSTWRNPNPGNYVVRAKVTFADGTTHLTDPVSITVQTHPSDVITHQVWAGFAGALQAGNTVSALQQIVIHKRSAVAARLAGTTGPAYGAMVASLGLPQRVSLNGDHAEYAVNRWIGGKLYLSFVYFAKDEDGTWRIAEF